MNDVMAVAKVEEVPLQIHLITVQVIYKDKVTSVTSQTVPILLVLSQYSLRVCM